MKKLYLIILVVTCLFSSAEDDFLKTLNESSEIATNNRLNINKIPSNIEVINRDFIIKSGARTLLDVLEYMPGVEISMNSSGKKEIIIRGNKSTYRDKIKFLINGEEVTNNLFSNQFYYYNFPAKLIKRIEFTKTPDAIMYGDKAYLGVINIITLDELNDNEVSFYQSNKKQTTLTAFGKIKDKFLIDAHYEISNPTIKKTLTEEIDIKRFKSTPVRYNRPNELEKEAGVGIRYKKENEKISYRIQYYKKGNFFGLINLPPLKNDKGVEIIHQYINYNYSKFLTTNIKNSFNIGVKHYQWKGSYRVWPVDFNFSNPDSDAIGGANIKEYELYMKNITTYNSEKHISHFLIETKYSKPYEDRHYKYINNSLIKGQFLTNHKSKRIYATALDDLFIVNKNFNMVYGGRYSYYNDFGGDFSYKVGSIYNLNNKTIFKVLFNTAFRVPSWMELYAKTGASFNGNSNLKAEKIKMLEFTYLQTILQKDKLRVTVYRGKAKNYIERDFSDAEGKEIYNNLGNLELKGFEVNYKKVYTKGKFDISYSYNNNKALFSYIQSNINYYNYSGNRKVLIKGYNLYDFNKRVSFFTGVIYGSKINVPLVKPLKHYFTLNTNLNYHKDNYKISIGINNLTNYKNYYLSMPTDFINGRYFFIQKNGAMPLEGRKIYVSVMRKF